jgi:protein-tyrosine-phosphatase
MQIVFICTGNTCRSPMAEAYLRKLCADAGLKDIKISSAGTYTDDGQPPSHEALRTMKAAGIDISGHRSSRIHPETLSEADLILVMTRSHREWVLSLFPEHASKTRLLLEYADRPGDEIADPAGGGEAVYRSCFEDMKTAIGNLFLEIQGHGRKKKISRTKPQRHKDS